MVESGSLRGARRYRVRGRVQGVGFRWSARRQAAELGIDGWVRNLGDGSVEVFAQGGTDALARFEAWLASGPPGAAVTEVAAEDVEWQPVTGFDIVG